MESVTVGLFSDRMKVFWGLWTVSVYGQQAGKHYSKNMRWCMYVCKHVSVHRAQKAPMGAVIRVFSYCVTSFWIGKTRGPPLPSTTHTNQLALTVNKNPSHM